MIVEKVIAKSLTGEKNSRVEHNCLSSLASNEYKVLVGKMRGNVTLKVNSFPHPHIQPIRNYAGLADDIII